MSTSSTSGTDSPICPHCGHRHRDASEWGGARDEAGEHDCERCGKPFTWTRYTDVTYTTTARGGDTQ